MVRELIDKHSKSPTRRPRRIIAVLCYIPALAVCCAFFYGGQKLCARAFQCSSLAPYNFRFPQIISYAAIVVGAVLMAITVVFIMLDLIGGGDKYL
jgi:TRAP-type C4-dicarboxylate transport system permease small subunit